MQIFFDFDDVLFHTADFTRDFAQAMCASLGVTPDDFHTSYLKARENDGIDNYSFARHVDILHQDYNLAKDDVVGAMEDFTEDLRHYVFADVRDNLQKLKNEGHELFLVTFGSPRIQERKIAGADLENIFTAMEIGEFSKADAITRIRAQYGEKKGLYIEDRLGHLDVVRAMHGEGLTGTLMLRSEGRYSEQSQTDERYDQYEHVHNMTDVVMLVDREAQKEIRNHLPLR